MCYIGRDGNGVGGSATVANRDGIIAGGIGKNNKDKKHFQMFIPMFLAMNAVGWMLLAMKAVALLTIKALFVSKLAFVVAASVIVKKLMDTATEK